jgi:hypothetical protein
LVFVVNKWGNKITYFNLACILICWMPLFVFNLFMKHFIKHLQLQCKSECFTEKKEWPNLISQLCPNSDALVWLTCPICRLYWPILGPLNFGCDSHVAIGRSEAQMPPMYPCYGWLQKQFDATRESCLKFNGWIDIWTQLTHQRGSSRPTHLSRCSWVERYISKLI